MKVTKALLKRLGACKAQREKFAELFPRGVVVTEALCVEHAQEFNWDWAANHLLSPEAWAEYNRVRALAWAEYNRVMAPAKAEYDRVAALAFGRLAEAEK